MHQLSKGNDSKIANLRRLPIFCGKQLKVSVIDAGDSASVFDVKVCINDGDIGTSAVEKLHLAAKYLGDIHYETKDEYLIEPKVQQLVAKYGLAPKVYYYDDKWLISEFIDGEMLHQAKATEAEKLRIMLGLLSKLHQLELPENSFVEILDIKSTALDFIDSVSHLADLSTVFKYINLIELGQQEHVLCHGDANYFNVICGEKVRLIDFTATSLAPKEYDLGMMLAINRIDKSLVEEMIEIYVKHCNNNTLVDSCVVMRYAMLSCVINGCWYLQQYQQHQPQSPNPHFIKCAHEQFDYLANISDLPFFLTLK